MTNHNVTVSEVKEISDQLVSYKICCCGDELHSSWHTIAITVDDHESLLEGHKKVAADLHEKKLLWRAKHQK